MHKKNKMLAAVWHSIQNGIENDVLHLIGKDEKANGTSISVGRKSLDGDHLANFISYNYLGLDIHPDLVKGAIDAAQRYGVQWGASRAYVMPYLYDEYEEYLKKIFQADVILAPSTTLAHQAALPVLITKDDVVLLDQHVHSSVQTTAKMLHQGGVEIQIVRHNDMDKLESMVQSYQSKKRKIWYLLDGVYSMYGDLAPFDALNVLINKYAQLNLYIDDAHGMSWSGMRGGGVALERIERCDQVVIATSLNKAFSAGGGALVFFDHEQYKEVKVSGPSLIFCTPIPPPMLGVGVASAKLHLQPEFIDQQAELKNRINYFKSLCDSLDLPLVSKDESPIQYIGIGQPKASYHLMDKLIGEGFLVGLGLYPAVAANRTGLRICMNANQEMNTISKLARAISDNIHDSWDFAGRNRAEVNRLFKLESRSVQLQLQKDKEENTLRLVHTKTIREIDPVAWNQVLGDNGNYDWEGLEFMESNFREQELPENNWEFHYFLVYQGTKLVLATFLTKALCKDDLFFPGFISEGIEKKREYDPYYLCSEILTMGSMFSMGEHLFLDRSTEKWKEALSMLLMEITKLKDYYKVESVMLRGFDKNDKELSAIFHDEGYVQIDLPESSYRYNSGNLMSEFDLQEDIISGLSKKSKRNFRSYVLRYEKYYTVKVNQKPTPETLQRWYDLYQQVKDKSFELNTFHLQPDLLQAFVTHKNWDIIELYLSDQAVIEDKTDLPIAVVFCYASENSYVPLFMGLDYKYLQLFMNYKQALYQMVKRFHQLGKRNLYLGFTAATEKRRVGAETKMTIGFFQNSDSFNLKVLEFSQLHDYRISSRS